MLCYATCQWPILKYEQMSRDENPGKKLFENIGPWKPLVGILGDSVALEIACIILSFSVSDPLKRRPLRDHGNVPYVYGHIVLVAQSTSPYCDIATADRRSNCCPCVCRLPRLCADIVRLKCGRWISFDGLWHLFSSPVQC